jgi:hypothetical protein
MKRLLRWILPDDMWKNFRLDVWIFTGQLYWHVVRYDFWEEKKEK